jgi:hypothetical protein
MLASVVTPEQRFHPIVAERKQTRLRIEGGLKATNYLPDFSFAEISGKQLKRIVQIRESSDLQSTKSDVAYGMFGGRQMIKATN